MTLGFSLKAKIGLFSIAVVYLVVLWFAIESVAALYLGSAVANSRENLQQRLTLLTSKIEVSLYKDIFLADSLTSLVSFDPNFANENWPTIASNLINRSSFVRNLGIAPNDVISKTYPIEGNEASIGLDYRTVPAQHDSIIRARTSQNVYLAGPVNLVQGGVGLIARYPIFSDFPDNRNYWGVVSVVIDYSKLLESLNIPSIDGAEIAIRNSTANTGQSFGAFFGEDIVFENSDFLVPVTLPGARWELAAKYNINELLAVNRILNVIRGVGWSLGIIILFSIVLFLRYLHYTRIASLQDELTHLPNRRFAMIQLQQLMQVYKEQRSFAILNIDLNEFKSVNDTYGHHVGDQYLQHIANVLKRAVRASDPVSRMGGDEFVVILHRAESTDSVVQTINKIEHALSRALFFVEQKGLKPSVSIGFAMANEYTTTSELLKAADSDMYKNKFKTRKAKLDEYSENVSPLKN